MKIFKTNLHDKDVQIISRVLTSGELGFGPNVSLFEREFASFSQKKYNVATNSASASAFMIFSFLVIIMLSFYYFINILISMVNKSNSQ